MPPQTVICTRWCDEAYFSNWCYILNGCPDRVRFLLPYFYQMLAAVAGTLALACLFDRFIINFCCSPYLFGRCLRRKPQAAPGLSPV